MGGCRDSETITKPKLGDRMDIQMRLVVLAELMNLHPLEATVLPALFDKL